MATRETRQAKGRRAGLDRQRHVIAQLRDARMAAGISQRALANVLGWSATDYWRFENSGESGVSVIEITTVAAVLGFDASISLHPAGAPLRDKGHEALIGRLRAILSPAWRARHEVPFPMPGDPRCWDLLLRRPDQIVGVEAETRVRDLQAIVRRMRDRGRAGGVDLMLLVLSDSGHNRRLAAQVRTSLGDEFAAPVRSLLRALRSGQPLPGLLLL